jgi:aspartate dehydrogenase
MVNELARLRVALIGCGNLGGRIARGIAQGVAGPYELCAVMDRALPTAEAVAGETGAICCSDVHTLLDTKPHFVVEAATAEVLQQIARDCLRRAHLVVLSTGAFADDAFLHAIKDCAIEHGTKIYIASGALGGFDIVQAARLAGTLNVRLATQKPPRALQEAPSLQGRQLSATEDEVVFRGNARAAIDAFPQNVNVAVALSLAGNGVDQTEVEITSKPGLTQNRHVVSFQGAFGSAHLEFDVNPSPDNPRSSLLAAYSVLALLRKLQAPIQI